MNTPVLAAQPQNMAINLFDPAQFETMQKICKMYVNSDLVPESYRVTDKRPESKARGELHDSGKHGAKDERRPYDGHAESRYHTRPSVMVR